MKSSLLLCFSKTAGSWRVPFIMLTSGSFVSVVFFSRVPAFYSITDAADSVLACFDFPSCPSLRPFVFFTIASPE